MTLECSWCGEPEPTLDCPECCPCDECYADYVRWLITYTMSPADMGRAIRDQFPSRS